MKVANLLIKTEFLSFNLKKRYWNAYTTYVPNFIYRYKN